MAGGLWSPAAGDTIAAASAIDFWSKQVIIICTSGTRPASPRSGMTIWQTDTLTYAVYGTAWCETTPYAATTAGASTTTSTSYANLADAVSTAVTVTTGTKALLTVGAQVQLDAVHICYVSAAISGATTLAAGDATAFLWTSANAAYAHRGSASTYQSGLTAGANVWTLKYKVDAGTLTAQYRALDVVAIPT